MICKEGIVLAYSGGTDSAFLLQIFRDLLEESPFPFHAVMMSSVFQKKDERSAAEKFAEKRGIPLTILPYDPFQVPEIRNNSKLRCYYCKKLFFTGIRLFADSKGCRTVIDGTNLDDLGEYRPGHRALQEAGVFSPLAENGFSFFEIIANSPLGMYIFRLTGVYLNFLTKSSDMYIYGSYISRIISSPYQFQKIIPAIYFIRISD